jgi:NAD+ diphosphatase
VVREVLEEVGVVVDDVCYQSGQSWPFPHQIMVGFTARYVSGEIAIDATELAHAAWFDRDGLPELPQPYTIARRLIDAWLASTAQER